MKTYICQVCGKEFGRYGNKIPKYCSIKCKSTQIKNWTSKPDKGHKLICKRCGKEFISDYPNRQVYCSKECRYDKHLYICKQCGKEFWRKKNGRNITFCCAECRNEFNRVKPKVLKEWLIEEYVDKRRGTEEIAKETGEKVKTIWNWLRVYGIPTRSYSEVGGDKLRKYLAENGSYWEGKTGELCPAWKGGASGERGLLQHEPSWKKAVSEVWKRDNAMCQRCGVKKEAGIQFDIHHKYSFAEYKQLRTNPDNLVLLCHVCHLFVHSNKNFNKEFMLRPMILPEWLTSRTTKNKE